LVYHTLAVQPEESGGNTFLIIVIILILFQALQALSMPSQTIASMNKTTPHDRIPQVIKDNKPTENFPTDNFVFGNDVDTVDIAVRVALVKFFLCADILGGVHDHIRTLRLYPRPVVALQKGPFLKSRPRQSDFVLALSETQVCTSQQILVFLWANITVYYMTIGQSD
jgi:hypothetical protein